jgi:hypothetical protein
VVPILSHESAKWRHSAKKIVLGLYFLSGCVPFISRIYCFERSRRMYCWLEPGKCFRYSAHPAYAHRPLLLP